MQARELLVTRERQVEVCALQVRPAVSRASEDPVESVVDFGVLVGPELGLGERVHPRMHGPGHEPRTQRCQLLVGPAHVVMKSAHQPRQGGSRSCGLELEDVEGELVRPADAVDLRLLAGRRRHPLHELVADGLHRERPGVDDHGLDLDTVRLEEAGPGALGERRGGLSPVVAQRRFPSPEALPSGAAPSGACPSRPPLTPRPSPYPAGPGALGTSAPPRPRACRPGCRPRSRHPGWGCRSPP